jgi:ribosome-binding protein aMBF1 (putative translation factor)
MLSVVRTSWLALAEIVPDSVLMGTVLGTDRSHADHRRKAGYAALDKEFQFARTLIAARMRAGLSQAQLACRMNTSQSYVARVEGGKVRPSTDALERLAHATGTRLRITFEPEVVR